MSASPLVLLHGWGLTPGVWAPLVDTLGASLDLHAPALPGHADAAPVLDADVAAWGEALLPAIPPSATVCAWSLGALIALHLAHRHPERIRRLVLIGATPCFVSHPEGNWTSGLDPEVVRSFSDDFGALPGPTQRRFVALQALGDAQRKAVANALTVRLAAADAAQLPGLAAGLTLLAQTDLRARIPEIRCPVHLVHGARDALMPLSAARWLHATLPTSDLTVIDGCGHAPFLTQPQRCADLIRAAIDE